MMIGTAEVFVGIMVIVLAYIAYTLIKQLRTLEKTQSRRIDLMVIGSILYWLDVFISAGTQRGDKDPGCCRTADIPVWVRASCT